MTTPFMLLLAGLACLIVPRELSIIWIGLGLILLAATFHAILARLFGRWQGWRP